MDKKVAHFNVAYDAYYNEVNAASKQGLEILEIGGGAHPSIVDRSTMQYTIIDPDEKELVKSPDDCKKICSTVQEYIGNERYDLIISKMVLEHVENPDTFHTKVHQLLKKEGVAIHFFACRHSIPAWANRLLPEAFGDTILQQLGNRNTSVHPKYPAFYRRTKGGLRSQVKYLEKMGYEILKYQSFVGHKYFRSIPVLKQIEQFFSWILVQGQMKSLTTVALVVLKKENE